MAILNFIIFLGGSVFVTVSQTLLEDQLNQKLTGIVPDLNAASLTSSSATSLRDLVAPDKLQLALTAYNDSMKSIWYLGLALACVAFVASFGLGWRSVKNKEGADKKDDS